MYYELRDGSIFMGRTTLAKVSWEFVLPLDLSGPTASLAACLKYLQPRVSRFPSMRFGLRMRACSERISYKSSSHD